MAGRRGSGLAWIAALLIMLGVAGCVSTAQGPVPDTPELAQPAAAPGRVAPPPPVDYFPREFNILYDRGEVLAQSERAIGIARAAAEYARTTSPSCVVIIGNTDTVGSDAANMSLSIERARALAEVLRRLGVEAPIYFAGRGENDLARLTPDDTDEPLNRRVTVAFAVPPEGGCRLWERGVQSPYELYPD